MITIPYHISFVDWASTVQVDLPTIDVPVANSADDWKEWALFLIEENDLIQVPIPNNFKDWRDWADYFVNVI